MALIRSNLGCSFRDARDPSVAPLRAAFSMSDAGGPARADKAARRLAALRQVVEKLERGSPGAAPAPHAAPARMPLGLAEVDCFLPDAGLACGALHEVTAAAHGDWPAAFGFALALTILGLGARRDPASTAGPAVLVASRRSLRDFGQPYGHGLHQLGLDAGRLIVVETRSDKDALWAIEETLKSKGASAMVVGAIGGRLDLTLTASRRLSLAAATTATPLVLLSASTGAEASAAVTRWHIGAAPAATAASAVMAAPAAMFARSRWSVALARCRNGRTGQWLLEWDHVTHRFHLAQGVADCTPLAGRGEEIRRSGFALGRRLAG